MSRRAFKYFSIAAGGTPQPLIGTTLTAAISPSSINTDTPVTIPVADSSMFLKGDWVILDVSPTQERAFVFGVPNSTSVQISKFTQSHASGTYVSLAVLSNSTYVQSLDGNTGALYIGLSNLLVKATGVQVVVKLQAVASGVQPIDTSDTRAGAVNADDVGQIWIDGTTGDKYLPSIGQV